MHDPARGGGEANRMRVVVNCANAVYLGEDVLVHVGPILCAGRAAAEEEQDGDTGCFPLHDRALRGHALDDENV